MDKAKKFLPALALGCLGLATGLGVAAAEGPVDFAMLGREVVARVGEEFFDGERAARWVEEHAGLGEGVAEAEVFTEIANAALAELGASHTHLYSPEDPEHRELLAIFEGALERDPTRESLGLGLRRIGGEWFVARVFAGGAGEAAGLLRGDRLARADGEPFHPVRSLAGKAGREVLLEVERRPGERLEIGAVPAAVHPREEWLAAQRGGARVLERDGRALGYAPMWVCAGAEYQQLLADLLGAELAAAEALVLDFRGGWGGCNPELLNLFNPAAPELTWSGRGGERGRYAPSWRRPVVVLLDAGTRSGKEVVARALQRHGLATLVGQRSAGAVAAGRAVLLSGDWLLFLAVADVRVDGERLEGAGVTPHVPVPDALPYAAGADPRLDRALAVASELLEGS